MAIGAKLKQILEDRGLKATDIAAQTGLSAQTIINYRKTIDFYAVE